MPRTITEVKVFVASPGDLKAERNALEEVIADLNHTFDDLHIRLLRWEKDTVPAMGRPQGLVNEQLGDYDIFVGLMWRRFGTSTGVAESGTEEEFNRAYERWQQTGEPPIMFYFCDRSAAPPQSTEEVEQLRKVVEFRQRVQTNGLTGSFTTVDEFKREVGKHLTRVLKQIGSGEIRRPASSSTSSSPASRSPSVSPPSPDIYIPRRRQEPTDRDKRQYVRDGYAVMLTYFREASAALSAHDPAVEVDIEEITARSFTCEVFVDGESKSIGRVFVRDDLGSEQIALSLGRSFGGFNNNSMNDWIAVAQAPDGSLSFQASGMSHVQSPGLLLTPREASEHYWRRITEPLVVESSSAFVPKSFVEARISFNERQSWFIGQLRQGQRVTAADVAERFGVTQNAIKRDIAALRDASVIRFVGTPKNGRYEIA